MDLDVGSRLRTLRSFLPPRGNKEETVLFAKYGSKDDFEMGSVPNGTTVSTPGDNDDEKMNGSILGVESLGPSHPKNAISEWQAGWNVTNAIQVRNTQHLITKKSTQEHPRITYQKNLHSL